jgi:hypothetical protein
VSAWEHGTYAGYNRHVKRHEKPCSDCREARKAYQKRRQTPGYVGPGRGSPRPLDELAWERVDQSAGPLLCWPWLGEIDRHGYGILRRYEDGHRRHYLAHRLIYCMLGGSIPAGLDIDHLCRVRHCVNPTHLEPVTRQVNVDRGLKSRGSSGFRYRRRHVA